MDHVDCCEIDLALAAALYGTDDTPADRDAEVRKKLEAERGDCSGSVQGAGQAADRFVHQVRWGGGVGQA